MTIENTGVETDTISVKDVAARFLQKAPPLSFREHIYGNEDPEFTWLRKQLTNISSYSLVGVKRTRIPSIDDSTEDDTSIQESVTYRWTVITQPHYVNPDNLIATFCIAGIETHSEHGSDFDNVTSNDTYGCETRKLGSGKDVQFTTPASRYDLYSPTNEVWVEDSWILKYIDLIVSAEGEDRDSFKITY
jgi:hypothetical protein